MNAANSPAPRSKRPRSPEFVRTAKALLLRQRTKEAINLLRRGLNLDPACSQAALLLSKCLVAAKRLKEARNTLEKLLQREEALEPFVLLVRVLSALDDHPGAIEAARRGLALYPADAKLRELQNRSRLELADLLDDTTERDEDEEDRPTTKMPERDRSALLDRVRAESGAEHAAGGRTPFLNLLAEAGIEFSSPDTVPMAGTALTLPPVPEELSTSPNYRQADDGALVDPLVVVEVDEEEEGTPTPMPSDELNFDRPPVGASDMVSAVKQLVEPKAVFDALLAGASVDRAQSRMARSAPHVSPASPLRAQLRIVPPAEDPDQVGGPTPADTPGAKRAEQSARTRRTTPTGPRQPRGDNPTLDLRKGDSARARMSAVSTGERQPSRPRLEVVEVAAAAAAPASAPHSVVQPAPFPLTRRRRPVVVLPVERPLLNRWWPLWLTMALLVIASSTVAGLMVRQRSQVQRNLAQARALAARHQMQPLKQALYHVREAANLGGRDIDMVALAARIHAELVYEFGESSPQGAESLVAEANRLEGLDDLANPVAARDDLAVAQAYLQLIRTPLPEALSYLVKSMEQHPSRRLRLLYGRSLVLNGELDLARRSLEELPADDREVLQARALLYWKSGQRDLASRLLGLAGNLGLSRELITIEQARFETLDGVATAATLETLQRLLLANPDLPRRQAAWAHLLLALLHHQQRHHTRTVDALKRALLHRPLADADFSYQAGRLALMLHRLDPALHLARHACRIAPRVQRHISLEAAVELAMDRPAAAIQRLSGIGDLAPEAALILARALIQTRHLQRAQQMLDQLPPAFAAQVRTARAQLQLAAGRPYQALKEIGEHDGQPVDKMVLRGLVALRVGDTTSVVRWMKTALRKDPMQANALWALGVVARQQADARQAVEYLTKAVEANPYRRSIRRDLGQLHLRMGNLAPAQHQFDEVLKLDPADLSALVGRARITVEQGTADASLYIQALNARGHATLAARLQARQQMINGELALAARALRRLLDRRDVKRRSELLLWLAQTEHRRGDTTRAAALYRQILDGHRPAPAAHLGLSELNLGHNLGAALRQVLAAAQDLSGGIYSRDLHIRVGVHLARCYRQGDSLGAAIAELQDVLELNPSNLDANLELGQIYAQLNKRDRAVQHLARVLDLDGKNGLARRELARACHDLAPSPPDCHR